ncbi:hypothetical protein Sm713_43850 [Streptomyces sp. TS71-3]|nr:hypothetical protein Sm713_43850 [Streptomyces sp. TS71-3]
MAAVVLRPRGPVAAWSGGCVVRWPRGQRGALSVGMHCRWGALSVACGMMRCVTEDTRRLMLLDTSSPRLTITRNDN